LLIEKELIIQAKENFGNKAIELIKDYFNIEKWDEKNSKGSCPFGHSDTTPSFIWNPKNHCFHCFSCNRNFGIIDLYMKQGLTYLESIEKLFDETDIKYKFGERGVKTKRNYKYPVIEYSEDRTKVEEYFATRKISKETLDYCNIGQDKNGNIIWKFFDENDVLLTIKLRPARKIKEGEDKEWYLPNYDNTPILFNMNRTDYTNGPLVITEGQGDTLSIIEAGYYNVVSVPGGSQNTKWIEVCYDWLEKFDQIIIWSDSDESGIKMRKEVVSRLGQWRCKYVEIPEDLNQNNKEIKDANAILFKYGKQIVLDLIHNAQEIPIYGVSNMATLDDFCIETAQGIYTGLESLDDILYKFIFGNVLVITGKRGEGKSSFVNQILVCEGLQQGYDSFIFSGELSAPVLKTWINVTMAGAENVEMKGKFIHVIKTSAKKKMEEWYDNRIWIYDDKKSNKAEDILDKAISVTRKYGTKIWILDNLLVMDIGSKDTDVYEKQKDFMTKLIGLADLYNVLIALVIHPRKSQNGIEIGADDVGGSGALTNLPQYVLTTKRFNEKEKQGIKDGKGNYKKGSEPIEEDVAITVLKNRYVGKIGEIRLYFDYRSRRFFTNTKNLNKRYKWDNDNKAPLFNYNPLDNRVPDILRD
jgi:replicative DNA helicase